MENFQFPVCRLSIIGDFWFGCNMVQQYKDDEVQQAHDRVYEQGRTAPKPPLPPGITEAEFIKIIQALKEIVGDTWVHTEDSLLHFSDPFTLDTERYPSAAVW